MIDNFFVCVGAQKSGTTWLARVLAGHPDLFLTPVKEIHYFDHLQGVTEHLGSGKRRSRYRKYQQRMWTQWSRFGEHRAQASWYRDYMADPIDDAWYERLFRHRGEKRFAGELTPEYAIIGTTGFRHLARLAPAARVLFIMRNPVTHAWSQVLHQARADGIDAARLPSARLIEILERPRVRELGDYERTLADLAAVFPAEQTLTLFHEDVHEAREVAIRQICRFIGIGFEERWFPELSRRFNTSQDAPLPEPVRKHLRTLHRPLADAIMRRTGRLPASWAQEFA